MDIKARFGFLWHFVLIERVLCVRLNVDPPNVAGMLPWGGKVPAKTFNKCFKWATQVILCERWIIIGVLLLMFQLDHWTGAFCPENGWVGRHTYICMYTFQQKELIFLYVLAISDDKDGQKHDLSCVKFKCFKCPVVQHHPWQKLKDEKEADRKRQSLETERGWPLAWIQGC